ncbi:MAG: transcriptional repressor LexA [Bacteriovoracaceae bacterium]|nr:transcriptional repressor LexA [Bacteriovoracaceae bacterium]
MSLTKKQKQVYDYIVEYIAQNDYSPTQTEIKEHFGFKSLGSVQDYIYYLTQAGYLHNDSNAVRGLSTSEQKVPTMEIPLLGKVAAGLPIEAIEGQETVTVPQTFIKKGQHYALVVEGQSMIDDGILDGDIVVIKKQNMAQNGETVVASINQEATIKKYFKKPQHIELHPANKNMKPFIIREESFEIKGILVGLLRQY